MPVRNLPPGRTPSPLKLPPPPKKGGGLPPAPDLNTFDRAQSTYIKPKIDRKANADHAKAYVAANPPSSDLTPEKVGHETFYASPGKPSVVTSGIHDVEHKVHDVIGTQLTRASMGLSATLQHPVGFALDHGSAHDRMNAIDNTHVKDGKVVLPKDPHQAALAAGLLNFSGTGNYAQKAASDILGIPLGISALIENPRENVPAVIHQTKKYYETNPAKNLREDPTAFTMNYVLPAATLGGGLAARAGALADVARVTGEGAELSPGDVARLRTKATLQHYLEHGEVPKAGAGEKAKLYTRALVKPPHDAPRTYTIHGPDGHEYTFTQPSSRNHAVNLFHKAVTNRIINNALDGGLDIMGGRGVISRMIRGNLRVNRAVESGLITQLSKLKLSPAEEHAAWMAMKGVDPKLYAAYHAHGIDTAADEAIKANHQNGLDLSEVAAQHLRPGEENPKVMEAVRIMRSMARRREAIYGMSQSDVQHALGSHYHGIVSRALGTQDLHGELAAIEEQHGPPAANPREQLDHQIAAVQRAMDQSGPEHRAELQQHLNVLQKMAHDIEFKRHQIDEVNQQLLDYSHGRGAVVGRSIGEDAGERRLVMEKSQLEDELNQLVAHERHRQINSEFTAKGGEILGHVRPSAARDEYLKAAADRGLTPDQVKTLDNAALAWSHRTGQSTAEFYRQYAANTELGGAPGEDALFEIAPIHEFTSEREAQARAKYDKAGEPVYGNPTTRDANGIHAFGPITPPDWVQRVEHSVPDPATRDALARWYESFEPIFRKAFGDDAEPIMRGFAVSQANQSPAGGITATLRVMDKLGRGEKVTNREISTVAESIAQAVEGNQLLHKGLGQKLSDFTDSLRAMNERTITGHSPAHGAPTAIDIHAARDLGYVDPRLVSKLRSEGHSGFAVDNKAGSPTGIPYERMVKQYQQITDHLNEIGFDGRHDWTPAQTQALGWSAIQRYHGVEPEDLQFALDRNTYEIPYEVGNGMEGSRQMPTSIAEATKVTKAEEPNVRAIIERNGAYVRNFHYGVGGYEGDTSAAGVVRAIASPEQADRIAQDLADHYRQWEVWATRPGVGGSGTGFRSALEIEHPSLKTTRGVQKFWSAFRDALPAKLKDNAVGFTPIPGGIRVITSHPAAFTDDVAKFLDRYTPAISDAADAAGIDNVDLAHNNVEVRKAYGNNQESGNAVGAEGTVGEGDQGGARVGVHSDAALGSEAGGREGDQAPHAAEALHQTVGGEVRGSYEPGTATTRLGENANAETFQHEAIHAVRQSLDDTTRSNLEAHYGIRDGQWTRDAEERFVSDMQRADRGEQVPEVIQSAYNSSLVPPPEGGYLPFADITKDTSMGGQAITRAPGKFGHSPPVREAMHQFTGGSLDTASFSTKATSLAAWKFTKATHWEAMSNLFDALWALSKDTPEEAGRARFFPVGRRGEPIAIRDIRAVTPEQRAAMYAHSHNDFLEGEAPDEIAKSIMEHLTRRPETGEHVRYINSDYVRKLTPQTAGAGLRFMSGLNQLLRFGRYGPAYARWIPQNLVVNLTQQGPLILRNAGRLMTTVQGLEPDVYYSITTAMGHGSAHAAELDTNLAYKIQHGAANFWSAVADHVPRMLSFVHAADQLGFRDAQSLTALMTDPRFSAERQAVIQKANSEAIDYGSLSPFEQAKLKPFFATWPWVRAASLWAARFPFEHPWQTWAGFQVSQLGQEKSAAYWAKQGGVAPPYEEDFIPTSHGLIDPSAVFPWSQGAEDLQTYAGITPSHPEDAAAGVGQLAGAIRAGMELVTGRDQYGNPLKGGALEGSLQQLAKTFAPYKAYANESKTGGKGAIEGLLGDPLVSAKNAPKDAKNAVKDLSGGPRETFHMQQFLDALPAGDRAAELPTARLAVRLAQIGSSKTNNTERRQRIIAVAGAQNWKLSDLNAELQAAGLPLASQGDMLAERAKVNAIQIPSAGS